MENVLKTRDVADKLGVSQKTVRKWIKHFALECESNHLGHYVINRKDYEQLQFIHEQTNAGKKLSEIKLPMSKRNVSSDKLDERFNNLLHQIDQLDRKIQTKAGEVVEYQMLQHRREIDDISDSLEEFNHRLKMIESKLNKESEELVTVKENTKGKEVEKKGRLANIFSF